MQVWALRAASLSGDAAGADTVERQRVRRAFEAALPPLADMRRHPLRCGSFQGFEYRVDGAWAACVGCLAPWPRAACHSHGKVLKR